DWTPEYIPEGCPPSSNVQIKFPKNAKNNSPITMHWTDGGIRPFHPDIIPAEDWLGEPGSGNGVIMIGEKGTMTCGTYGLHPKIYLNNGEKIEMEKDFKTVNKYADLPEYGHQVAWTEACKAGFQSKEHKALTSSFDYAGPLNETVLMGNVAIRSYMMGEKQDSGRMNFNGRRKMLWDGAKMKITNYDDANEFVGRDYREGWKLI
ncbi:MAG: gfo/Idh/MocA family oxidoreductase, partial [Cyclobacteriaceae bacterium]|nr:gfo/Idh/MocA family oxidoreductase [Cyclobacteriaceae bacterium]